MSWNLTPIAVATLLVCAPTAGQAGGVLYKIDPSYTTVAFDVANFGGLFATHGLFTQLHGDLLLDLDKPENSQVDVTAETASVETGWGVADDMLRSADYLDPRHFPTIRYVARQIQRLDQSRVVLQGYLTLHGVTRAQTFTARLEGVADQPGRGPVANFVVGGDVDRRDYGMTADYPLVDTTVTVTIRAHILLTPQTAADVR